MTNSKLGTIAAILVLAAPCLWPAPAWAQYGPALQRIRSGKLQEAEALLRGLSEAGCRAMAYYLLGYVNAHLDNPEDTIRNAARALTCEPSLSPKYREESAKLLRWAALRLSGHSIRFQVELSDIGSVASDIGGGTRDLEKLSAQRELIEEAVRHVPGLREQIDASRASASSLNQSMLCSWNPERAGCERNAIPQVELPEEEE